MKSMTKDKNVYIPLKMYVKNDKDIAEIEIDDMYREDGYGDFINSSRCKSRIHKITSNTYKDSDDLKSIKVTRVSTTNNKYICTETYASKVVFEPGISVTYTFVVIGLTLSGYAFLNSSLQDFDNKISDKSLKVLGMAGFRELQKLIKTDEDRSKIVKSFKYIYKLRLNKDQAFGIMNLYTVRQIVPYMDLEKNIGNNINAFFLKDALHLYLYNEYKQDIENYINGNVEYGQDLFNKLSACMEYFMHDLHEVNKDELLSIRDGIGVLTNNLREYVSADAGLDVNDIRAGIMTIENKPYIVLTYRDVSFYKEL